MINQSHIKHVSSQTMLSTITALILDLKYIIVLALAVHDFYSIMLVYHDISCKLYMPSHNIALVFHKLLYTYTLTSEYSPKILKVPRCLVPVVLNPKSHKNHKS